jgi:peptide/nickel transport system permease protein
VTTGPRAVMDHDAESLARKRYFESTPRKRFFRFWREFVTRRPLGAVGLALMLVMIVAAALADKIAPYDPTALSFKDLLAPPSPEHLFGTDNFGRDVFTRVLYGARTALLVGFTASLVGCTLGLVLGIVGAYVGGRADEIIQRLMDVLLSFPLIVIAIAVVAALGTGEDKIGNVIAAITVPIIPRVSRVVRSSALSVVQMPYIEATRSVGTRAVRIMFRHIAPNVFAPYLIMMTAFLGQAILLEASLSFLGLGVFEPTPSWGLMLRGAGMQFLERAPWLAIAPGVAISMAVFGFNLFGDSLRDALDPRLRTA